MKPPAERALDEDRGVLALLVSTTNKTPACPGLDLPCGADLQAGRLSSRWLWLNWWAVVDGHGIIIVMLLRARCVVGRRAFGRAVSGGLR